MKEYRTSEQWETMVENMINGNWTDAAQNAVDFGWWAGDIQKTIDDHSDEWIMPDELSDFMYITEQAQALRSKK
jgi:hypothetical protein